jgi:hypothetical protein
MGPDRLEPPAVQKYLQPYAAPLALSSEQIVAYTTPETSRQTWLLRWDNYAKALGFINVAHFATEHGLKDAIDARALIESIREEAGYCRDQVSADVTDDRPIQEMATLELQSDVPLMDVPVGHLREYDGLVGAFIALGL